MSTELVDVPLDFSDVQLAEVSSTTEFSSVPVPDAGRVTGVITHADFLRALAERFAAADEP